MDRTSRIELLVSRMIPVVIDPQGRTPFVAALRAAREGKRLHAELATTEEGPDKDSLRRRIEYATVRKMWFTGRLTEAGLRNYCRDRVEANI